MFTAEELKNGAKRAVLEYISENGIPTARIYSQEEAMWLGPRADLIVRADNACQLDGFSGVFGSYRTRGDTPRILGTDDRYHTPSEFNLKQLVAIAGLDDSFESGSENTNTTIRNEILMIRAKAKWYCDQLKLPPPERPDVFIQDAHSDSIAMFQHPNNPNLVVMGINKRTVLYERTEDQFTYMAPHYEWEAQSFAGMQCPGLWGDDFVRLRKTIEFYDKTSALPKLSDMGSTFEMEFGWHRDDCSPVVYQVRLFRKVEQSGFRLPPESGKNIINFDLPVGITTSSDGIRLNFRHMMTSYDDGDFSGSASLVFPFCSEDGVNPPHVRMPGVYAFFFPVFDYRRDHGVREAIMKTPLALCDVSEFDGMAPGRKSGIKTKDHEVINIRAQGLKLAKKLDAKLEDGHSLRLYSDGITGRVVIE